MTDKESRFILAQAANAAERIAHTLERFARVEDDAIRAAQLEVAASDLAHHADAIRHASGIHAATEANLAAITANPSTR